MSEIVRPLAGDGLIAHERGLLLVCDAFGDSVDDLLEAVQVVAAEGGDGRALARRIAQVLAASMSSDPVACAVAGPVGDGVAVLVSGAATATVTGPGGDVRLAGRDALTWTDRLVAGPVSRVELALPGAAPGDPRSRLGSGVIAGAGIEYVAGPASPAGPLGPSADEGLGTPLVSPPLPPAPPPPPEHVPVPPAVPVIGEVPTPLMTPVLPPDEVSPGQPPGQDLGGQPFESVLLVTEPGELPVVPDAPPAPEPDPRPEVLGVECKDGHFNDPRAPYCAICGIALVQRTLIHRKGPRPPLGVLLFDDGMTLRLDADYLIGRDPERSAEVKNGSARPVRITDKEGSVSRRHLGVALEGWDVKLVDLGSANGTRVQPPGDPEFHEIPRNEAVTIAPGTRVLIGGSRTFRYESHRN